MLTPALHFFPKYNEGRCPVSMLLIASIVMRKDPLLED